MRVNDEGSYLFADLRIARSAPPGPLTIELSTASGLAEIPFEILNPLPAAGRFQGFSSQDAIYLIMPDRFANGDVSNDDPLKSRGLLDRSRARYYHGGDLQGVIDKLPYLGDLGITAIWLTPLYDNNDRLTGGGSDSFTDYHGYGAVDFYSVEERFGSMALLRQLVDRAHSHGIKVILDQVANHTGPRHPWVSGPPLPSWFNGTADRHLANAWQTWTLADPRSPPHMRRQTLEGWFLDLLPDLNQNEPEVARYLIQNTLWWIGSTGIDGIRQDTLPYVPRPFWRDWTAAIKRQYPSFRILGEVFDSDPALVSFFQGSRPGFDGVDTGIDGLFDFPAFYPLRSAFAEGKPVLDLARMMARDHLYPRPERLVAFLGLHDVPRFMNVPGADADGMRLAWTFLATARGAPLIYYGDELGMPGGEDPDNRRDFPGGWPNDPRSAFTAGGRLPGEARIFDHLRTLLRFRRSSQALRMGEMTHLAAARDLYVYSRRSGNETVIVALNNSPQPVDVIAPVNLPDGRMLEDILGGGGAQVAAGHIRAPLRGRTSAVWRQK